MDLSDEQNELVEGNPDARLRAHGDYRGESFTGELLILPTCGLWTLSDDPNENFRERFKTLATQAGLALGPPQGTMGLDFWLHRLFLDLLENRSLQLFAGQKDEGGIILDVCEASASYCARLERGAVERSSAPQPAQPEVAKAVFRKMGEFWEIGYEGQISLLKDIKGFHFISRLLREPGKEIEARELVAETNPAIVGVADTDAWAKDDGISIRGTLGTGGTGNVDDLADKKALKEYRERLKVIAEERKEAEEAHNAERIAILNWEVEKIEAEVKRVTGRGGRIRRAASPEDQARSNVTMLIRAAIQKISAQNSDLGSRLNRSIKTGMHCSYRPDPTTNTCWNL